MWKTLAIILASILAMVLGAAAWFVWDFLKGWDSAWGYNVKLPRRKKR